MIQQIPKIRIGNTIHVGLAVMAGGQPRDLTGLAISVFVVNNKGTKTRIREFTIDGDSHNVIHFTLQGLYNDDCGIYKVIVLENANRQNQAIVDTRLFELVRESAQEEGVNNGLVSKNVNLEVGSILIGGRDGTGVASIVQTQSSSVSLGENIWKVTLTDGREANFIVKNGAQGAAGHTPVKGTDYFTPTEVAAMVAEVIEAVEVGGGVDWASDEDVDEICI